MLRSLRHLVEWFGVALGVANVPGSASIAHLETAALKKDQMLKRAVDQRLDACIRSVFCGARRLGAGAKSNGEQT
jgi:hypothetical protein